MFLKDPKSTQIRDLQSLIGVSIAVERKKNAANRNEALVFI